MTGLDEFREQRKIQDSAGEAGHNPFHHFVNADGALSFDGELYAEGGIAILAKAIHTYSVNKGWWPECKTDRNFGEVLALIHSEVSEALEDYRNDLPMETMHYTFGLTKSSEFVLETPGGTVYGKPCGIASEMADIIIRVLDACEAFNIPVEQALIEKHRYNLTRAYRHGGKKA